MHLLLATRQSLLLTSQYHLTLQTNSFIASDEIVFATHLQIPITLQTNMFIASNERVLSWGRTLGTEDERIRAGDEHFRAGDKHFSAGDKHAFKRQ